MTSQIGVDADSILQANPAELASALKPGGMVPELRAMRLKEIAERVLKRYGGDLRESLNGLSTAQKRGALKQFRISPTRARIEFCCLPGFHL